MARAKLSGSSIATERGKNEKEFMLFLQPGTSALVGTTVSSCFIIL